MLPGEDVEKIPAYRNGLVQKYYETRVHVTPGTLEKGKRYFIEFTPRELTWQGSFDERNNKRYMRGFFTYLGFKIDTSRKQENDPSRSTGDKKSMRQYRFVDGKGAEFSLYQAAKYAGTQWEQHPVSSNMVIRMYPVEPKFSDQGVITHKYANGNKAKAAETIRRLTIEIRSRAMKRAAKRKAVAKALNKKYRPGGSGAREALERLNRA